MLSSASYFKCRQFQLTPSLHLKPRIFFVDFRTPPILGVGSHLCSLPRGAAEVLKNSLMRSVQVPDVARGAAGLHNLPCKGETSYHLLSRLNRWTCVAAAATNKTWNLL